MKRSTPGVVCYTQHDARTAAIFGWSGAACILIAYALASFGVFPATHVAFPVLNGLGAAGVVIEAMVHRTVPVLILNAVWFLVAIAALIRLIA